MSKQDTEVPSSGAVGRGNWASISHAVQDQQGLRGESARRVRLGSTAWCRRFGWKKRVGGPPALARMSKKEGGGSSSRAAPVRDSGDGGCWAAGQGSPSRTRLVGASGARCGAVLAGSSWAGRARFLSFRGVIRLPGLGDWRRLAQAQGRAVGRPVFLGRDGSYATVAACFFSPLRRCWC